MRRSTLYALLLPWLFLALPACDTLSDATPALEATRAAEGIFLRQSQAFEQVVTKATGITAEQREAMLAGLRKDREDYKKIADALNAWLQELGEIDWIAVAKRAYEAWRAGSND